MRPRVRILSLLIFASFVACVAQPQPRNIRVAAAADLKFAMTDLAAQYESQGSGRLDIIYGSSGNFFSQIQNGAPFDIFFSADITYPKELEAAGLTEPGTLAEYSIGRIAIWAPADSKLDLARQNWTALLEPSVLKIAIANPQHAPYGRAAVEALQKAGIYQQVKTKLVYGENIVQASQFVQSGNAQVGILALSLIAAPPMRNGERWEIPQDMHAPIEQAAVILKNAANKEGARAFLDFVKSDAGQKTLAKYGFLAPLSTTQKR